MATEKAQAALRLVESQIRAMAQIRTESLHVVTSNTAAARAEIQSLNGQNTSSVINFALHLWVRPKSPSDTANPELYGSFYPPVRLLWLCLAPGRPGILGTTAASFARCSPARSCNRRLSTSAALAARPASNKTSSIFLKVCSNIGAQA